MNFMLRRCIKISFIKRLFILALLLVSTQANAMLTKKQSRDIRIITKELCQRYPRIGLREQDLIEQVSRFFRKRACLSNYNNNLTVSGQIKVPNILIEHAKEFLASLGLEVRDINEDTFKEILNSLPLYKTHPSPISYFINMKSFMTLVVFVILIYIYFGVHFVDSYNSGSNSTNS